MSVNANKAYAYGKVFQNPSVARADGINRRDSWNKYTDDSLIRQIEKAGGQHS